MEYPSEEGWSMPHPQPPILLLRMGVPSLVGKDEGSLHWERWEYPHQPDAGGKNLPTVKTSTFKFLRYFPLILVSPSEENDLLLTSLTLCT